MIARKHRRPPAHPVTVQVYASHSRDSPEGSACRTDARAGDVDVQGLDSIGCSFSCYPWLGGLHWTPPGGFDRPARPRYPGPARDRRGSNGPTTALNVRRERCCDLISRAPLHGGALRRAVGVAAPAVGADTKTLPATRTIEIVAFEVHPRLGAWTGRAPSAGYEITWMASGTLGVVLGDRSFYLRSPAHRARQAALRRAPPPPRRGCSPGPASSPRGCRLRPCGHTGWIGIRGDHAAEPTRFRRFSVSVDSRARTARALRLISCSEVANGPNVAAANSRVPRCRRQAMRTCG